MVHAGKVDGAALPSFAVLVAVGRSGMDGVECGGNRR